MAIGGGGRGWRVPLSPRDQSWRPRRVTQFAVGKGGRGGVREQWTVVNPPPNWKCQAAEKLQKQSPLCSALPMKMKSETVACETDMTNQNAA